ncbi:MAG TPA: DUF1801 domain-containing protein [Chitinophagaceae bacterium]|nr:DUF1801 domain-containing protein [Chitinophagaceae bacterium]
MRSESVKYKTVDEYFSYQPAATQKILQQLRRAIKKAAPKAEEGISYNIPAYKLEGMLVFFAAYKNHIGFYPTASGITSFKKELSKYKTSRGAVQFPIGEPLPLDLITRMVKARVKENTGRTKMKARMNKR